jgi:hypothetical protein
MRADVPATARNLLLFPACVRMIPWGVSGADRDGDPVLVVCAGRVPVKRLAGAGCTAQVVNDFAACMIVFMYDHYLPALFPGATVINLVVDAAGVSADHVALAKYVALHAGVMHHQNYPGKHKRIIVVNANAMFRFAWKVLKYTLVAKELRDKVEIITAPTPSSLQKDCVPAFLGGESPSSRVFERKEWEASFWEFCEKHRTT